MIRKTSTLLTMVLTMAALALSSAVLAGEIYKWTDENGNVHYEDRPLGEDVQRMDVISRRTDNSAVQASIDARRDRESAREEARAQRNEAEKTAAEARAEAAERAEKCTESRARMESFLQARRLYKENESGEREYLDDEQVMAARDRAQEQIQKYCD